MRFFLNQAIAFLALAATAPLTQAFPTGAGGCVGGEAAVGGNHLSRATPVTGTLAEGGITVSIDSVALDPGVTTKFNDTVAHTIIVVGTEDFLGILIRVQAADGVNTTNVLLEGNELLEPAAACAAPIVGITHSSRTPKNNAIVILTIPGPGLVTLDVTVVFANVAAESIYYYTGFNLEAVMNTAPVNPPCNVCGVGKEITIPDGIIINPTDAMQATCVEIEVGAAVGLVAAALCPFLAGLAAMPCGCMNVDGSGTTPMTTTAPTDAPADSDSGATHVSYVISALMATYVAIVAVW